MLERKIHKKKKLIKQDRNIDLKLCEIKTIFIPENRAEKELLLKELRCTIGEIDNYLNHFKLKKDYYLEIVEKIEKDLQNKEKSKIS